MDINYHYASLHSLRCLEVICRPLCIMIGYPSSLISNSNYLGRIGTYRLEMLLDVAATTDRPWTGQIPQPTEEIEAQRKCAKDSHQCARQLENGKGIQFIQKSAWNIEERIYSEPIQQRKAERRTTPTALDDGK